MICPHCRQLSEQPNNICPHCGFDISKAAWIVIRKVYPPDDIIMESLLISQGIPVKLLRKEVSQMPVTIGPMAEVKILVPESLAEDARNILDELILEEDS